MMCDRRTSAIKTPRAIGKKFLASLRRCTSQGNFPALWPEISRFGGPFDTLIFEIRPDFKYKAKGSVGPLTPNFAFRSGRPHEILKKFRGATMPCRCSAYPRTVPARCQPMR
jgi:hypothetical protein